MAAHDDPRIGTTLLGKLRVDGLLGEGGMGAVYRVHHVVTKHDRALKVLHAQYADDAVIYQRLLREAGVAGTLRTDHVVETFDVGKLDDGSPYVLMELMDGETLAERLEAKTLSVQALVGFICQACEGIVHAHAAGIIHRDLKPDNLFLVEEEAGERIKLLDFGISKFHIDPIEGGGAVTQEGTVMGTPLYMSPEQAAGKTVGPQTDIYSLGVILYEGLTGKTPHQADSYPAFLLKLHTERPTPIEELAPDVDPKLAAIVDKALATQPEDRYPSAQALLRVLLPFAEGARTAHLQTLNGLPSVSPDFPPPSDAKPPTGIEDTMAVASVVQMDSTAPATPSQKQAQASADEAASVEPPDGSTVPDASPPESVSPPVGQRPIWPWAAAVGLFLVAAAALAWSSGATEADAPAEPTSGGPVQVDAGAADVPAALDPPPVVEESVSAEPPTEDPPPAEPAPTSPAIEAPAARPRPTRPAGGQARPHVDRPSGSGRFEIERDNPY